MACKTVFEKVTQDRRIYKSVPAGELSGRSNPAYLTPHGDERESRVPSALRLFTPDK